MRVAIADDQCVGIADTLSDICALTSALLFRPTCRLVLHASLRQRDMYVTESECPHEA